MNIQYVYYGIGAILRMRHILSITSAIDTWYFIFYESKFLLSFYVSVDM